jgi:hypothetical protein
MAELLRSLCSDERELFQGEQQQTRIHVRVDLRGLAVKPDVFRGGKGRQLTAHQYSFMAFARFLYNRICMITEGHYESLPNLGVAAPPIPTPKLELTSSGSRSSFEEQPAPVWMTPEAALAQVDPAEALVPLNPVEDTSQSDTRSRVKAKSMIRLHAAVTPLLTDSMEAEVLICCCREDRSRYREAVGQDAKNIAQWKAQRRTASLTIGVLKKHE